MTAQTCNHFMGSYVLTGFVLIVAFDACRLRSIIMVGSWSHTDNKNRGVDKFFQTLAKLANSSEFSLAVRKQLAHNTERVSERGEKLTSLSEFVCLLAKLEFYSHLASWRVVIRTPARDFIQ
jgi:hypothetical protein